MITVVAEKPSVGKAIAQILGANEHKDGYLTGNGYCVSWAFGHLVSLAMPSDYGIEGYERNDLPMLPYPFKLKIRSLKKGKSYKTDMSAQKQLGILKRLFSESKKIIVATDAGREGELIFRYIYEYLNCQKPFERLWISSLTDKAIREGLNNLKAGRNYDALYEAGKSRSEADWLVGLNASRALTLATNSRGTVYSLGRVQTPTLAMLCKRYLEHQNFTPSPYWKLHLHFTKDGQSCKAVSEANFENFAEVETLQQELQNQNTASVESVQTNTQKIAPPLLYDLTTLQKEANRKYGFTADKTLSIAQRLYEKKVATYPRTGSRYISDDIFEQIPKLIAQYSEDAVWGTYAQSLAHSNLHRGSVNTAKVSDHHALLPTENRPTSLSKEEEQIYQMLVARLLEAFSAITIKEVTRVKLLAEHLHFQLKGESIQQLGWQGVLGASSKTKELPRFRENEDLSFAEVKHVTLQTQAKPLFNEASLLSAMELAGKEVEDANAKEAMKECGLGTPATRASIIETLLQRGYVERKQQTLIPTEKGLQVYELIKGSKLADATMTGEWEYALLQIEQRKISGEQFRNSIERYTEQITHELLALAPPKLTAQHYRCPKCGDETVGIYPKIAKCQKEACGFKVFRTVSNKLLSEQELLQLLQTGKTPLLKGVKSKAGKSFDAYLVLNEDGSTSFEFPPRKFSKTKSYVKK